MLLLVLVLYGTVFEVYRALQIAKSLRIGTREMLPSTFSALPNLVRVRVQYRTVPYCREMLLMLMVIPCLAAGPAPAILVVRLSSARAARRSGAARPPLGRST